MVSWQEEQMHALLSIPTADGFFAGVTLLARQMGFEYCAYGLRSPVPISKPKIDIISNYPASWQHKYQQANYITVDPTVRHGIQSPLPVIWSDELFIPAAEFWEEAKAAGLRVGWALASRGANGLVGMVTLARDGEPLSNEELREKGTHMIWLAQVTHVGMSHRLGTKLIPELTTQLSPREIEVLRWTAEGKTSGEIAVILNITERTVNFHILNVTNKLQTHNKIAAAVRASLLGLLY